MGTGSATMTCENSKRHLKTKCKQVIIQWIQFEIKQFPNTYGITKQKWVLKKDIFWCVWFYLWEEKAKTR